MLPFPSESNNGLLELKNSITGKTINIVKPATLNNIHDIDEPLRQRMANGDDRALGELMDRHMHKIHGTAYRMLGDNMKAEDVTQMVFLKLWQMAPTWETGRGTILTYLYRITNHRCLDILRKAKESLPGELPDIADESASAFNEVARTEQSERVQYALEQLPDRQRAAITLFYYEHQSLKMAADILNITPSAFESLLRRGRKSLKSLLTPEPLKHLT